MSFGRRQPEMPSTYSPAATVDRSPDLSETERLKQEVALLRERLARLNEASLGIAGSLDIDTVLQAVIDASRLLTGARYGAILTFDDSGEIEGFFTSGMSLEEQHRIGQTPRVLGILDYMNELDGPLRLSNIASHPRSVGFPKNHPPMKSFLGIPIRREGKHLGNIYLAEKERGEDFTPEDEESLSMFASQSAASIANSRIHRIENHARADLEALLDISPVAVLVFDARTRTLVSYNPEAKRIVHGLRAPGRRLDQLLSVITVRRPDGKDIPIEEMTTERAILSGETIRAREIVIHLPDGKVIPVLCSAAPIFGEDGEVVSVVTTLQDMTPLEDQEKQRAQFLGMLSYALRSPITSIKGATATLQSPSAARFDSSDTRQFLRIIDESADRVGELASAILDVNRIETGMLSVDTEPVDPVKIMEQAKHAFLRDGQRNHVTFDVGQRLPAVLVDRQRIVQVLVNLLKHASKCSPDWSEITVSASLDGPQVVVSVTDQGAGISPARLPYVFRGYSDVNGERPSGLNVQESLGLVVCKGLIEAHGGRIWAESDGLGLGSRFTFTILAAEEGASDRVLDPRRLAANVQDGASIQASVLMAGNNQYTREFVRSTLFEAGYTPLVTSDPDEALYRAKAEKPDLIMLDFSPPDTLGIRFMERVIEAVDVPVVFLSDQQSDQLIARAFEAGAEDHMTMPFSQIDLVTRVKSLLAKRVNLDRARSQRRFVLEELAIDYIQGRVTLGDSPVHLTPTEYKLLCEFSTNAGHVLTHDHLLRRVWSADYSKDRDAQVLRNFVKSLRRKLGDRPENPTYIVTVPARGYRMRGP